MRIISNRRKSSLMNVFVAGAAAIAALCWPKIAAAQTITIHALRFISGQRGILCHWGAELQFVSRLSLRCAWKRMAAFASADGALAVVSDGGQDRPPWPADVFEDQRRHAGHVRRDPRALRAHHAARRRHSRNVLTPGAAFSHSGARNRPPTAEPRPKRHKIVSAAAEIISQGSVPRRSTAEQ